MGDERHRYYKYIKFNQNPRGDQKFLVVLTRNDPHANTRTIHSTILSSHCSSLQLFLIIIHSVCEAAFFISRTHYTMNNTTISTY